MKVHSVASVLLVATLSAQTPPTVVLEPFTVTGSHVKRLDYETPSPVVTFTADAIAEKGFESFGDFLQSQAFNAVPTNSESNGTTTFIPGAVTINPRGVGSNRVLTLVNGRRAVPFALPDSFNGTPQSVFNFAGIPLGAIERVEFLKDGASAIYGSDAISGVVNIILRKNYSGSAVDVSLTAAPHHDALVRRVNLVAGLARDGWNVVGGASHQLKHAAYLPDIGTHTVDYTSLGAKGATFLTAVANPAVVSFNATQAASLGLGTAGFYLVAGGAPSANPTKASFIPLVGGTVPAANSYDPANDTQISPASETTSAYTNLEHRLRPGLTAFASFSINRAATYYELQPFGTTSSTNPGFSYPATNPYNPFGITLNSTGNGTTFGFVVRNPGVRLKRELRNTATSVTAGLRGTAAKIWDWESAVSYGANRVIDLRDQLTAAALQAALSGTTRATAFNIFGPSDNPRILTDRLVRSRSANNQNDLFEYTLTTTARPWRLPWRDAGEPGVAAGYDYRRDTLHAHPDTTAYVGFGAGTPFHGDREAHSVFVEFTAPLQRWIELQLAARHERYSDFGTTTQPKIGVLIRLPRTRLVNALVRGSYSESFKAPDLGQLYAPQSFNVFSTPLLDPLRPQDPARQLSGLLGGNPRLKPERAHVQFVGTVLEFPGLPGLSLTADYLDIRITDVIRPVSPPFLLSPLGMKLFPDAIVRDNSVQNPGPILYTIGTSRNLALQLSRGWDFSLNYALRPTSLGTFKFSAEVSQVAKLGTDTGLGAGFVNTTGRYFAPVWRSNLGVNWRRGDFAAALRADVIGKYFNDNYTTAGWGENAFTTLTPSFTYTGWKKTSLTLGANNVLDHRPAPIGRTVKGFNDRAASVLGVPGITFFLRARREF
ncbi:MAG: TonB-dependent receptor [Verrucomicrobia bacterium]|nr:TonB-dependent receptor [Verrucomicrobiota bacterium]